MKHLSILLFLVFIAILSSCGTQYHCVTGYMDYSKYANQGFFITEAPTVPFNYTPVGSMTVTEYSGKDKGYIANESAVSEEDKKFDDLYGNTRKKTSHWHDASPDGALAAIVERAKFFKADGIIGVRFETVYSNKTVIGYTVSGMLIKR